MVATVSAADGSLNCVLVAVLVLWPRAAAAAAAAIHISKGYYCIWHVVQFFVTGWDLLRFAYTYQQPACDLLASCVVGLTHIGIGRAACSCLYGRGALRLVASGCLSSVRHTLQQLPGCACRQQGVRQVQPTGWNYLLQWPNVLMVRCSCRCSRICCSAF
jgi:hypothetical protein